MRELFLAIALVGCGRGGAEGVTWTEPPEVADPSEQTPGCSGVDDDNDGVDACTDCDDAEPLRFPGAPEICDGLDDDCDGQPHEGEVDLDGDGELDCAACDQAGFWIPTRDLDGDALISMLVGLIEPQWCADYSDATDYMFLELDRDPVTSEVECVYTGRRVVVGVSKPDPTDFNTEHTWPQSLGAESLPAKCDLHHLYPTDSDANNTRAAHPFGEVTGAISWEEGGSKLGDDSAGNTVFEPRESHKGNVARSMLYFAHRYGYPLTASELALYKAWHAADRVDPTEQGRSFSIAGAQVVPNPFVTCPELVEEL